MLTPGLNAANPALPQRRPSNSNYQWHPARHLAHTSNRAVNNKHNWTATLTTFLWKPALLLVVLARRQAGVSKRALGASNSTMRGCTMQHCTPRLGTPRYKHPIHKERIPYFQTTASALCWDMPRLVCYFLQFGSSQL